MTRIPLLCAAALFAVAPATAQDDGGDSVNQVIVYGEDECPMSDGDTITVCARLPESERYRIPPRLRQSDSPERESWTERAESLEAVGRFGPLSCTPVGAGGELGCTMDMIAAAYAEKAQGSDVRFGQLIAEARAERLSEIDEEAAETQARVEELERAYLDRLERERDADVPETYDPAPPPAEIADPDRVPPADLPPPAIEEEDELPRPLDAAPPASYP